MQNYFYFTVEVVLMIKFLDVFLKAQIYFNII